MKWFFKWISDGIDRLDKDNREAERRAIETISMPKVPRIRAVAGLNKVRSDSDDGTVHLNQQPMHFKIYPASGGHIVEYNYYNERKDSNDQALHLIPSDLDLGAELAKIMTLEALKR